MTNLNIINANLNKENIEFPEEVSSKVVIEKKNTQINSLSGRLIGYLNQVDLQIDKTLPDNIFQKKLDQLTIEIKEKFMPLNQFSNWLSENESGEWMEQLANYLVKLPLRSARNIINLLYRIISIALYTSIHPLKGVNDLAKKTILLLNELTKPSSWAKMGCGSIGALVGKSFILGNPISLIGFGIGGALTIGGISIEAFQSAVKAEKSKEYSTIRKRITPLIKQLPEAILTGFFMGVLVGGIKRSIQKKPLEISEQKKALAISENTEKISHETVKKSAKDFFDWDDWKEVDTFEENESLDLVNTNGINDIGYFLDAISDISLDQAKGIANSDPNITHFIFSGSPFNGEASFFSGRPWAPFEIDGVIDMEIFTEKNGYFLAN